MKDNLQEKFKVIQPSKGNNDPIKVKNRKKAKGNK